MKSNFAYITICNCPIGTVPFYRYWNGRDHFYTTDINEIGTAVPGHLGKHGYTSEGTACQIHDTQVPSSVPLYRYYNGHDHFYTTNANEIGTTVPGVTGKHGYKSEGIAGYCFPHDTAQSDGDTPLYRAYNSGNGDHFYTTSVQEMVQATLPTRWTFEGITCYVGQN